MPVNTQPRACKRQQNKNVHKWDVWVVCSPSSSSVRVSANTSGALFSPRSPPVASNRFSSALDASCVKQTESQRPVYKMKMADEIYVRIR